MGKFNIVIEFDSCFYIYPSQKKKKVTGKSRKIHLKAKTGFQPFWDQTEMLSAGAMFVEDPWQGLPPVLKLECGVKLQTFKTSWVGPGDT